MIKCLLIGCRESLKRKCPEIPRVNEQLTPNCCSVAQSCLTLCNPMDCSTPGFSVLHCLLESAQTHVHWIGHAIQPSHPLSPLSPPAATFPSIRVFCESALRITWPKDRNFSFSISLSREYSGLISFRMNWFDILAAQGTRKSLLQHHSSKHQFFGAQLCL